MSKHYQGIGGAPGICIGHAFRYVPTAPPLRHTEPEDADTALERFRQAQQRAAAQLQELEQQLRDEGRTDEADILDAQALFVEDEAISSEVARRVREEHQQLEAALDQAVHDLRLTFAAIDNAYWRERAADIEAVGRAIYAALHNTAPALESLPPGAIIIATDLTPAETASLRGGTVGGFATAYGGPTGHTAILARSLGIPAVVGLGAGVLDIEPDSAVILDGDASVLLVQPDESERTRYEQRIQEQQTIRQRRQALQHQPGQTADGHPVELWANIGRPDEVSHVLEQGAAGIGLFRTEFLFLGRSEAPGEDEQYAAYGSVLSMMGGRPVVARTLDIGGDKPIPYLNLPDEPNPFLGMRGLRLCMQQHNLFRTQLRALLRAALHGDLRIMLPMIATPADLAWGSMQLRAAAESLAVDDIPHRADVPLGIMIETPAAAMTADLLARDAAFFSIGSNDLTQYAMAADRGNAELADAYPHDSIAVLRLIAQAATAAHAAALPIGVCGELAAAPDIAPLLVGLGIDELSMVAGAVPIVKERLLAFTREEAQAAAKQALAGGPGIRT
jgi:phosphotransferase system enzyme I (PtsI)